MAEKVDVVVDVGHRLDVRGGEEAHCGHPETTGRRVSHLYLTNISTGFDALAVRF